MGGRLTARWGRAPLTARLPPRWAATGTERRRRSSRKARARMVSPRSVHGDHGLREAHMACMHAVHLLLRLAETKPGAEVSWDSAVADAVADVVAAGLAVLGGRGPLGGLAHVCGLARSTGEVGFCRVAVWTEAAWCSNCLQLAGLFFPVFGVGWRRSEGLPRVPRPRVLCVDFLPGQCCNRLLQLDCGICCSCCCGVGVKLSTGNWPSNSHSA
eukprot:scaffold15482_cov52-Phaeocystis_antarctica.AAC.2